MPNEAQHGYHLALVMESVGDHVKQNECRAAQLARPPFRALGEPGVQLLVAESMEIGAGGRLDSALVRQQRLYVRSLLFKPAGEVPELEIVHPALFHRQNVNQLVPDRRKAETWNGLAQQGIRNRRHM